MGNRLSDEQKKEPAEALGTENTPEVPKQDKKPTSSIKKRLIAVIVAISIVLVSLGTFLVVRHVRNNRPPALEAIRERTVALIEASHEINEIFWGEGLPTYPRYYEQYHTRLPFYLTKTEQGYAVSASETSIKLFYYVLNDPEQGELIAYQYCFSEARDGNLQDIVYIDVQKGEETTSKERNLLRYARKSTAPEQTPPLYEKDGVYYYQATYQEPEYAYTQADPEEYDYVRFDCKYLTTAQIKTQAEAVYADSFLRSVYESVFTGITVSENPSGTLQARYIDYTNSEGAGHLMKSNTWQAVSVSRVYLYDTMRMSEKRRSNARDVFLDIDTFVPGSEDKKETITVSLTLQNGSWFLNSATY